MYGGSIPNLNCVRADSANLGCGVLLKLTWDKEDWIFNISDTMWGGWNIRSSTRKWEGKIQVP